MNWLTNRLSEPTSYAGFGLFTSAMSSLFSGGAFHADAPSMLMGAAGILAFVMPEAGPVIGMVSSMIQAVTAQSAQTATVAQAASGTASAALSIAHNAAAVATSSVVNGAAVSAAGVAQP